MRSIRSTHTAGRWERTCQSGVIDVQILGIGSDGHIEFDETGSSLASRIRNNTPQIEPRATTSDI